MERVTNLIEEISSEFGWSKEVLYNFNLVLEEAVANIILYAYPNQKGKEVIVEAQCNEGDITFTITDCGIPFDPTQAADADITLSADERKIGGLGIFLMRQLMDKVDYHRTNECNVLTLKKYW